MQDITQSFLDIIEANKGLIFKVAKIYCPKEVEQEDLIQEIILQLWKTYPYYDDKYKISTWMYKIAMNTSISFYRKESRRSSINHPLPISIINLKEGNSIHPLQDEINLLHKYIQDLKEIDRALIMLYLEETGNQEIAEIMGMSETNVSTRLSRIRNILKHKFFHTKNTQK